MLVSKLSNYLSEHKRASVMDMSYGLQASPDALRAILARLESKGRVRRLPNATACGGGCSKCDPNHIELYEWIHG